MKITFIVAIYNVCEYLEECIDSILLNKGNYEVLLIDDGSTDRSPEICDKYVQEYPNVHVYHKENGGVSSARNLGISKAQGDWIYFVDGDDAVSSTIVDCVGDVTDDVQIIYTGFDYLINGTIKENSKKITSKFYLDGDEINNIRYSILNYDYDKHKHYNGMFNYNTPWAKLYNREYLIRNNSLYTLGIFRNQDSLFNYGLLNNVKRVLFLPTVTYHYRIIGSSVSNKYNTNMQNYNLQAINEYKKIIDFENDKNALSQFYVLCMKHLLYACKLNFCHPDNPKSFKQRKDDFLYSRNNSFYKEGYKLGNIKYFRLSIRPLAYAVKYKLFFLTDLMIKLMLKLKLM